MTLENFIHSNERNSHIEHPNFNGLYVRKARHLVGGELLMTFDIASVEASRPGEGAFRNLIEEISDMQPLPIFVENVLSTQFEEGLIKMGFDLIPKTFPPCYIKGRNPSISRVEA